MRSPASLTVRAPLARSIMLKPGEKPRGLRRLRHKAFKTLFFLLHQRLGLTAPGEMRLRNGARFQVNCANTGFLDFAVRSAADGCLEPEITTLLERLAPHLRSVYDIGANWGYFAVLLGTNPAFRGVVHAFEINPATFLDLQACVAGGGLSSVVTCHGFGLSDIDGDVTISHERNSVLTRVLSPGSSGLRVPVRRLDGLDLPPPDLVKVDVEDHEAAVFRGAAAMLRDAKPLVVFESRSPGLTEPLDLLNSFGYRLRALHIDGEELRMDPMTFADRGQIPRALNLLAVHPTHEDLLTRI